MTSDLASIESATLHALEHDIWDGLARAVSDKHHAWRSPSLLTCEEGFPDGRMVILRAVDRENKTLSMYTDARTPKVTQIDKNPNGMLLFWNPRCNWQVRMRCRLGVIRQGPEVDLAWSKASQSKAAGDYLSTLAPGAALTASPNKQTTTGDTDRHLKTTHHLAIITAKCLSIDWLELSRGGHRRAVFSNGSSHWVQA